MANLKNIKKKKMIRNNKNWLWKKKILRCWKKKKPFSDWTKAATPISQRQGHCFLYPPQMFWAGIGERGLAMKDRPWTTKNNALAEDLTGGEGGVEEGNKKGEKKKKWKREKRKLRKKGEYWCIYKVIMWSIYRRERVSKINENFGLKLTNVFYKLLLWPNFLLVFIANH